VAVRPRKGSAAICSRCHLPAPDYDQLGERRFEFRIGRSARSTLSASMKSSTPKGTIVFICSDMWEPGHLSSRRAPTACRSSPCRAMGTNDRFEQRRVSAEAVSIDCGTCIGIRAVRE